MQQHRAEKKRSEQPPRIPHESGDQTGGYREELQPGGQSHKGQALFGGGSASNTETSQKYCRAAHHREEKPNAECKVSQAR
ncbi:hypothetical protein GCM10009618_09990 [Nesterenkonia lacusekhoensis]